MLKTPSILICLLYYQRPQLVLNALQSIQDLDYKSYHVAFIDDSDPASGSNVKEACFDLVGEDRLVYCEVGDSNEKKIAQGGSRFGEYLNGFVGSCTQDFAIMLCDDDALVSDYFTKAMEYFKANPEAQYGYCHVKIFDPTSELPGPHLPMRGYFTNRTERLYPSCMVDASQVMWRTSIHRKYNCWFPYPQTKDLDAGFYQGLGQLVGPGDFMGCVGQYKAIFHDQLGQRPRQYEVAVK